MKTTIIKALIVLAVLIFQVSLTVHIHATNPAEYKSFENDNKTYSIGYHNSGFCSACRLDGKVNKTNYRIKIITHSSILYINQIEESCNNLHLKLLHDSRAPPFLS